MILKSNHNTFLGSHIRASDDLLFSLHCLHNRVSPDGDTFSAGIRGENRAAQRLRLTCMDVWCEQGMTSDLRGWCVCYCSVAKLILTPTETSGGAVLPKAQAKGCDTELVGCGCAQDTLSEAGVMPVHDKQYWGRTSCTQ